VIAKEEMRQICGQVQHCSGVTEFKQVEKKACTRVLLKWIPSWCDESCMGTEICLQFGRRNIRFALGD